MYQMQNPNFPYNNLYDMYQQPMSLTRVTGIEGAKAFSMPPNSVVALFDSNDDIFFVKTTDGAGFPTIRTFRFVEETETNLQSKHDNYINRDELDLFKKEIQEYVEHFIQQSNTHKSNNANCKSN